jgi:hypothetical protein
MKIEIGGKVVEGGYVGFDAKERWTDILLPNGCRIRMKLVIASVFVGKENNPVTGVPTVNVFSNTVVSVLPPIEEEEELVQ